MATNKRKSTEKSQKPVRPAATGDRSEKYLAKVPETVVFWCHDGQVFRSLEDLVNGFDLMSDETFYYHANDQKNDFSCWIVDIIGDNQLGAEIKKTKTRRQAKEATQQRYYDLTRLEG
jgi:hypothetical protein